MSEQDNGTLSPDGKYRWDGAAWASVDAAPEPTWSAAGAGSTVPSVHAMAKRARSFSVTPQQAGVGVVALVVVLVAVLATGGRKSTGSPATASAAAPVSPIPHSAPLQAKAAALAACSAIAALTPGTEYRVHAMSIAAGALLIATTRDPSSTVIATLAGNMTAWQHADAAFTTALEAARADRAAKSQHLEILDLQRSDGAAVSMTAAWKAMSAGCVNLGGTSLPAGSGPA